MSVLSTKSCAAVATVCAMHALAVKQHSCFVYFNHIFTDENFNALFMPSNNMEHRFPLHACTPKVSK